MLENALSRFDESTVVNNIANVIKQLHGLESFKLANNAEIKDLIDAFKARPEALIAFRKKLLTEPDSGMNMFYAGTEYAKMRVDQIKNKQERIRKAESVAKDFYERQGNSEEINAYENLIE